MTELTASNKKDFRSELVSTLGQPHVDFLSKLGAIASEHRGHAYLVGGVVRDAVLGLPSCDVDIMLDSSAKGFVELLYANWAKLFPGLAEPRKPIYFKRYDTAKFSFSRELLPTVDALDFSTARTESYPTFGEAPEVGPGTLEQDMTRRDFSVNALAVSLAPETPLELIDFFDGVADAKKKQLKILDRESFLKDPARLIRAVRLIARMDFSFEVDTAIAAREAIENNSLSTLPRARLFEEFKKAFRENHVANVVQKLDEYGLLKSLREDSEFVEKFKDVL